jgi:hypothetical protein
VQGLGFFLTENPGVLQVLYKGRKKIEDAADKKKIEDAIDGAIKWLDANQLAEGLGFRV